MHDPNDLDIDEIAMALADRHDFEHAWLFDPVSGEIVFWTRDTGIDGEHPVDLDELEAFITIEPLPSGVWYDDMVEFVDRVADDRAKRRLGRALEGRGAFRRFKDELQQNYPEMRDDWYALQDDRAMRRAVEWLVDHGIVTEEAAQEFMTNAPRSG